MAEQPNREEVLASITKTLQEQKDGALGISATLIYMDENLEPMIVSGCSADSGAVMLAMLKYNFNATAESLQVSPEELAGALLQEAPAEAEGTEEGRG